MTEDKKMIALQLDIDLYNKLNELANKEDRSLSSFIRLIIKKYIKENNENGETK